MTKALRLLAPGTNSITITASSIGAADVSQQISVASSGAAAFDLQVSTQEGLPGVKVYAWVSQRGPVSAARVEFDADTDGTADAVVTGMLNGEAASTFQYPSPGRYVLTARVYDSSGGLLYSGSRVVSVLGPSTIGSRVMSVYRSMLGRLLSSDGSGAAMAISQETRAKYQAVFDAFGPSLPSVAGQLGTAQLRSITESIGEIWLTRVTAEGAMAFPVYLIKDTDGLWRIGGM